MVLTRWPQPSHGLPPRLAIQAPGAHIPATSAPCVKSSWIYTALMFTKSLTFAVKNRSAISAKDTRSQLGRDIAPLPLQS